MNGAWIKGLVVGGVIATAGGAVAGYKLVGDGPRYADVVAVDPVVQAATTRQVCSDVPVTRQKSPNDPNRVLGTVAGAVVGGVLGNQVGGGSGKKIATVAGAAAGGYAGNRIQQRAQANDTETSFETRCETVTDTPEQVIGYDVTYRVGDEERVIRMAELPGDRLPLHNGEVALNVQR